VSWHVTPYAVALFAAAVISAAAALAAWQRRDAPGGLPLALLMGAVAEWSLAFALEAAAVGVSAKIFWATIQYLGLVSSPVFLLMFALEYAQLDHWLTRRRLAALWVIPLVTMAMAATNGWHGLLWTSFTPSDVPGSNMLVYGHGPWFWIKVVYFYLLVVTAGAILVWASYRFRGAHRRQALALLIGVPLPWIPSAMYVFELGPAAGYDLTPFGFALTGLMLFFAMSRLKLFDLVPVARDTLIENMRDGVLVLDEQDRVVDANRAARDMLEIAPLIGRPLKEAFARWPDLVQHVVDVPEALTEICLGEDPPRYMDLRISPVFDRHDLLTGRLIVWRDVTERKQAQALREARDTLEMRVRERTAELERVNEELKRFAFIISHDLRAPLVSLKGFAKELRRTMVNIQAGLDELLLHLALEDVEHLRDAIERDVPETLDFVDSAVDRMDAFISAVLQLARLGRRELFPEPVPMEALVQEVVESLAHQIEQQEVQIHVGTLPDVVTDRTAMDQIIGNLLDNALKYLQPDRPGEIEITGEHDDERATFRVRDNGRGIAEDDMQQVFAPFRRVGWPDVPGEGMGLPYVQTLVRRHGGSIRCKSELGEGTTFTFTIANRFDEEERGGNLG
jgi:signal transduction histidine kinase